MRSPRVKERAREKERLKNELTHSPSSFHPFCCINLHASRTRVCAFAYLPEVGKKRRTSASQGHAPRFAGIESISSDAVTSPPPPLVVTPRSRSASSDRARASLPAKPRQVQGSRDLARRERSEISRFFRDCELARNSSMGISPIAERSRRIERSEESCRLSSTMRESPVGPLFTRRPPESIIRERESSLMTQPGQHPSPPFHHCFSPARGRISSSPNFVIYDHAPSLFLSLSLFLNEKIH